LADRAAERILVVESRSVLTPDHSKAIEKFEARGGRVVTADQPRWLEQLQRLIGQQTIVVRGSPFVRATVVDQRKRTIVHLFNLNVQRLSSFEDKVTSADDLKIAVRVPMAKVREGSIETPDANSTSGRLEFAADEESGSTIIEFTIPRLTINALVEISM
jgi:hypothetical protein